MDIYENLKNWRYGLHRLGQEEINKLDFPNGILLKIKPVKTFPESMLAMQKVLRILQHYPGRFSFEIWKDKQFSFHFFTSKNSAEGLLFSQLNSVYPEIKIEKAEKSLPEIIEGEFVSCCSLDLYGLELTRKSADDFHREPYHHILEAINNHDSKVIVQILFEGLKKIPKSKKVIVAQKYGELSRAPLFKCLVRIAAISSNSYTAWESCEHIARTFSVFDTNSSNLILKLLSFYIPILRDSYRFLESMIKRNFPLFSKDFLISSNELAAMVHLPVEGEPHGVEYSKPSLRPPLSYRK